jgi:hypothetical protein
MAVVKPSGDERYELLLSRLQHDGVMRRLADLARVPKTDGARENFSRLIVRTLSGAWIYSEICIRYPAWKNPGPRDAASEELAARTLRASRPFLARLSERDREELFWPFPDEVLGGSEPIQPRAHRRGRPRGTVKNRAFQHFVRGLFLAAERAGGRYSLEKNIGKGTVIEAIDMLGPYLPRGFVPRNLPFSTMQRIKGTLSKRRNGGYRTKN